MLSSYFGSILVWNLKNLENERTSKSETMSVLNTSMMTVELGDLKEISKENILER